MSKKKIFIIVILIAVTIALSVISTSLIYNNDIYKNVKYDNELADNVVLVLPIDSKKDEFVDIKTLNRVKLGSTIIIKYDGPISTIDNLVTGGDFMYISGVRKSSNDTYIVVDNIEITFVKKGGIAPDLDKEIPIE